MRWLSLAAFIFLAACRLSDHFSQRDLSTIDDMAADVTQNDLASADFGSMDLPSGPDMVLTCPGLGNSCYAGTGACAANGTVVCISQGVAGCNATIGPPDNTGAWHTAPAANGSWDWDCDGKIEYQYPTGSTIAPPQVATPCPSVPLGQCGPPNNQIYWSSAGTPCGNMLSEWMCTLAGANCTGGAAIPGPTEGCH